jgi:precorrin-8X/cobalt-precorrin-8 methylmutase
MPSYCEHAITLASFAQIDQEIGPHPFTEAEYSVVRRVIHTTADFEYQQLMRFAHRPFEAVKQALLQRQPIVTDVSMVAAGIGSVVDKTWRSPVTVAVQQAAIPVPSDQTPQIQTPQIQTPQIQTSQIQTPQIQTRSAVGMQRCAQAYPEAIFAIGNAPTALLALCEGIAQGSYRPALVIGAPVGFINVVESKQALAELAVPYILVSGRKGGSAIAAAILNALMIRSWEQSS